ncbi:MAG: hypothetical protein H0V66_06660, partial [Bdellovibrionales bacterium]|nr:hypothetical protein [Bdellovibrionales bacterium]
MHWNNSFYIIEFEKNFESPQGIIFEVQNVFSNVQKSSSLEAALLNVVKDVQSITKYERVMIYKFHEDNHGEVIAEAKIDTLDPFYGHHYPASDIPVQARNLFLKTFVRMIPDV